MSEASAAYEIVATMIKGTDVKELIQKYKESYEKQKEEANNSKLVVEALITHRPSSGEHLIQKYRALHEKQQEEANETMLIVEALDAYCIFLEEQVNKTVKSRIKKKKEEEFARQEKHANVCQSHVDLPSKVSPDRFEDGK